MIKTGIMIALLATTGGAATFTAHNSEPGDALYPVKTYVQESVDAGFALEAQSDADADAEVQTDVETNTHVSAQSQFDTLGELVNAIETGLRIQKETSAKVDAETDSSSNVDASSEVGVELKSNVDVNTENIKVEGSGVLEGDSAVRLGL